MAQESIRLIAKQLNKNKFLIAKPATDVFQCVQAFILLVKGVKTKDWLLAQLLMSCSLNQMVETILERKIEYTNIIQCKKLFLLIPQQQNSLGKLVYQLISSSINFLEEDRSKFQRSKSTQLRHEQSQYSQCFNKIVNYNKKGSLIKCKEDLNKIIQNRKILRDQKIKEDDQKKFELLKEQMKKLNKNSYFMSPRKILQDQQEQHVLSNNNSERRLTNNKQMRSLRSFRQSFYD
ncbi:unnamed protein product (macronuclear) [Paramecium tetraurelia]|uniref:ENTH domain-containing protein n=1 Tax=Paramecium tetraurelia TaxID=5888 RepID=A0CTS9_PARTE|nr:uncharacterized protein GSPATT00010430001 [Paramecium tetraurelia]CAK74196.1 unnamed protein product [Paramecium tetraurelia]|eukprot:XP_001441593.1 hypothetical protein (macronuclear) [Paramecium tetraurelia strain d4-2]